MVVDKAKGLVQEGRWLDTPRAKKLLFALLAVLGSAAVILSIVSLFRSPAAATDDRVFSDPPANQLSTTADPEINAPLSSEINPLLEGDLPPIDTPPLSTIDQLLSVEQPPPAPALPLAEQPPVIPASKMLLKAFWVQLGAYSSLAKANENAALIHKEFDVGANLKTEEITVNQQKLFRLRIGPYPAKEEGERILQLVRNVAAFQKSYLVSE